MIMQEKERRKLEKYILGGLISVNKLFDELYFLDSKQFKYYPNEFETALRVYRHTQSVSPIDLFSEGIEIEFISGNYYSKLNIVKKARLLFDTYSLERTMGEVQKLNKSDIGNIDDYKNRLRDILYKLEKEDALRVGDKTLEELVPEIFEYTRSVKEGGEVDVLELKTIPNLNEIIGGIVETDLIGIYGKEKSAKTTLAYEMILDLCIDQKIPGAVFSFEMDKKLMAMKGISQRLGISIKSLRNPKRELEMSKLLQYEEDAKYKFKDTSLYVIDEPLNEYEIESRIRRLKQKSGIKIVMIDYLMLIDTRRQINATRDRLNYLSAYFKRLTQRLKIPIILLSQANDSGMREAEAKGLSRDSNYYFYIQKLKAGEVFKVGGIEHRAVSTEYVVINRGIRHADGDSYFIMKFDNNKFVLVNKNVNHNNGKTSWMTPTSENEEEEELPF